MFPLQQVESQLTASNDGDFYRSHLDTDGRSLDGRAIACVYYFFREPKAFTGGALRLYDTIEEGGSDPPGGVVSGDRAGEQPSGRVHQPELPRAAAHSLPVERLRGQSLRRHRYGCIAAASPIRAQPSGGDISAAARWRRRCACGTRPHDLHGLHRIRRSRQSMARGAARIFVAAAAPIRGAHPPRADGARAGRALPPRRTGRGNSGLEPASVHG